MTITSPPVRQVPLKTRQSDEQLAASAAKGSMAAVEELFYRYEGPVTRYLARMVGDREEAADLFQEAFLRAHTNLSRYDPRRPYRAWFYRIATNLAYDHLRKVCRAPMPGDPEPRAGAVSTAASDDLLTEEVHRIVAALPEEQSTVFLLRHYQGLSYAEISQVCGALEATVRSRMHYAVLALREKLRYLVEEDDAK